MKNALVGILCLLIFAACHDVQKRTQLEQITELRAITTTIQQKLADIDRETWKTTLNSTQNTRNTIRSKYATDDTISLEFAQKLEDYKAIEKNLVRFEKEIKELEIALLMEENALKALQTDIQNSQGDRNAYSKNIALEKKRVTDLENYFHDWIETKTKCVNSYQDLHPAILEFTESL